jgi:L-asparaginase
LSKLIRACIWAQPTELVLITDSTVQTGHALATSLDKTIVTTDALSRARFRSSGARFNIGCAIGGVQSLPTGLYIAMNRRIWDPAKVRENVAANLFEAV